MKIKTIFAVLAASIIFTSCGLTGPIEGLLTPPVISDEQQAVYDALAADTEDNISLVYPRYGDNRSAFIFSDLDGDGKDEAIAFYRTSRDDSNVRVNIMKEENDAWRSVYDHSGRGTSVERVFFTEFSGKQRFMCIGYSYLTQIDKTLSVYSFDGGALNEEYSDIYNKLEIVDINLDGGDDVVLINGNTEEHPGYVMLVTSPEDSSSVRCTSAVKLRTASTEQVNTISGGISGGAAAVFIDSSSQSGTITTEVLYCVGGNLRNPASAEGSQIPSLTARRAGLSMDIDNDGIVEIPTQTPFPGYTAADSAAVTIWNIFENYSLTQKYYSLYVPSQGYCFVLPMRWQGHVTVKTDASTGERVFYKFNSNLRDSRLELMRITVCEPADEDNYTDNGYMTIAKNDARCIMVHLESDTDPLMLTAAEVENGMIILPT